MVKSKSTRSLYKKHKVARAACVAREKTFSIRQSEFWLLFAEQWLAERTVTAYTTEAKDDVG